MDYTMQLESKLQNFHQEAEKLKGKLQGLQGGSKQLIKAEAELNEQVSQRRTAFYLADSWLMLRIVSTSCC